MQSKTPTLKLFDHTFGKEFIATVPHSPGVYEFLDETGQTIYVGKAKDLRNRLGQYRNTRIEEDNGKVRRMLKAAAELRLQTCESDLAAQLLENQIIQSHKPKYNWVGTNFASYPSIGIKRITRDEWEICKTRDPDFFRGQGYRLFGCYKRKDMVDVCYAALSQTMGMLGCRQVMPHTWYVGLPKKSEKHRICAIDASLIHQLERMLLGISSSFIGSAARILLESEVARERSSDVQEWFEGMRLFYRKEAQTTAAIRQLTGHDSDFIPQHLRDRLQIIYRMKTS